MIPAPLRRLAPGWIRPTSYLRRLAQSRSGNIVAGGPFKGMRYVDISHGSVYIPKLLGIYERELHPQIAEIIALKPKLIVDIGAAEGYYAVGLAVRIPETSIVAFEMEPGGQRALFEMADKNYIGDRLLIRGKCEPRELATALGSDPAPVVICDVEGYEATLLDPPAVPALSRAAILVELHEFVVPGITEILKNRFTRTHDITHIQQEPRSGSEYPWRTLMTSLMPKSYLAMAVSEWRPAQMSWLWMRPRKTVAGG